jgi:hypothetical protein
MRGIDRLGGLDKVFPELGKQGTESAVRLQTLGDVPNDGALERCTGRMP